MKHVLAANVEGPRWPSTPLGLYLKPATQYAAADDLNRDLVGGPT